MHSARPQNQIVVTVMLLRRCRKKIGAASSATAAQHAAFPLLPAVPIPSLGHPEAICPGVTTGTTALRCTRAHFRRSQGSLVSGAHSPPPLSTLLIPFFPLDSVKFRELLTEKTTTVWNIVLNSVMPNVHI